MCSFSVKAEKLTPEIIRIGQLLHDSHEILTELPFRIWIQKYSIEEADEPCLTVEYSKYKNGESAYETRRIPRDFTFLERFLIIR